MNYTSAIIHQIYEVLSFSINQACKDKDCTDVKRDALAFGFTKVDLGVHNKEQSHEVYVLPVSSNIELNLIIKIEKLGHGLLNAIRYEFEFDLMSRQKIMMKHCNYYIEQFEIMGTKLIESFPKSKLNYV